MATVTIRNVPDEVLARLKELARANHRSMEEELRRLLAERAMDRMSVLEQIEAAYGRQRRPTQADEVDRWIRESRR